MPGNPLLIIEQVGIAPLKAFSTKVSSQTCVVLCGPSGCGKSRLLYALADMLPHEGAVKLAGIDCLQLSPAQWRSQVMLVPNRIEWWFETAAEHFLTQPSEADLTSLGLTVEQLTTPITQLSTGQKQRLGLLRAILRKPRVLLLDEPTANLDAENTLAVEAFVKRWLVQGEQSVIWCSHDEAQILRIADQRWQVEQQTVVQKAVLHKTNPDKTIHNDAEPQSTAQQHAGEKRQ